MQPYRPLYSVDDRTDPPAGGEDRALAFLLIVLGALRVAPAIARGEAFGAEATIAIVMLALGAVMIARRTRWARRRLRRIATARARTRGRRRR